MLDVVDGGRQRAFLGVVEPLFNVFRVQAGIRPDDADHRDVNGRENIRRRAQQHEGRQQEQHQ